MEFYLKLFFSACMHINIGGCMTACLFCDRLMKGYNLQRLNWLKL